jgi:hypothetical protein
MLCWLPFRTILLEHRHNWRASMMIANLVVTAEIAMPPAASLFLWGVARAGRSLTPSFLQVLATIAILDVLIMDMLPGIGLVRAPPMHTPFDPR